MLIMSIETSAAICSVALSSNGNLLAEYSIYKSFEHDRLLAELSRRITSDFSLRIDDLDAVAISAGPGSFTGLRIGAAFAKALCYANKPKLIAVPTLSALAYSCIEFAHQQQDICCALRSHKDLIYFQKFDILGNPKSQIIFDSYENITYQIPENSILCGNAFKAIKNVFFKEGPTAKNIDKLAVNLFQANSFINPNEFVPLYVKEFTTGNYEKNN
jgi:tRNA threonylcarbamoyladenosine biosynthesis protein TsaB